MNSLLLRILGCLLACLIATPIRAGDEANPYLTKDGRLKHALRMENLRPGDGGLAGLAWTIEPSGEWKVVPYVKGKPLMKPLRTGKLTQDQMAALANHLAAQDLLNLPKKFGVGRPVLPHIVTLRFGPKSTTLDCGTWDDLTEVAPPPRDPQAAGWSRFIALALVIENLTKAEKAPVKNKSVE